VALPFEPHAEFVKVDIDHGRGVEREQLAASFLGIGACATSLFQSRSFECKRLPTRISVFDAARPGRL
jgi:hypothetical protein